MIASLIVVYVFFALMWVAVCSAQYREEVKEYGADSADAVWTKRLIWAAPLWPIGLLTGAVFTIWFEYRKWHS